MIPRENMMDEMLAVFEAIAEDRVITLAADNIRGVYRMDGIAQQGEQDNWMTDFDSFCRSIDNLEDGEVLETFVVIGSADHRRARELFDIGD